MSEHNGALKIGVYVCDCGVNISNKVNVAEVVEFARDLPYVTASRSYKFMCSDPGQDIIEEDIKSGLVNRVVVASCSPLMHEETFRNATIKGGENPFLFQMANIREHVSWVTEDPAAATTKAKALVAAAVRRVALHVALERKEVPVHPDALVVGGGIAGIQAALTMANAGKKVYLVEREATIGGHMAKFDKTFPTLDCSACILTPKMVSVDQHPNIELLTYSEVEEVTGYVGNFKAKIRRKARYLDEKDCNGCGECSIVCSVHAKSEWEMGKSLRPMIFRPFPQSVPNAYVIDKKGRAPCRATCPAGVHAQGYIALVKNKKYREAFNLLFSDIPLPSVCGRVCYHPCEDKCERGNIDQPVSVNGIKRFVSDWVMANGIEVNPSPLLHEEKVAVVGSGPAGLACANDLVRRGYRVTVFEACDKAGGMLRYGIPAYRLPDEILDHELDRLINIGIDIKTNSPVKNIKELKDRGFKAVFIATGAPKAMKLGCAGEETNGVRDMLTFLKEAKTGKIRKLDGPTVIIGGGNSAIDAARTAARLCNGDVKIVYRRSREEMPAHDWEVQDAIDEGVKLDYLAAPVEVLSEGGKVTGIRCIRMRLGEPDKSGRRRPLPIEGSEFDIACKTIIPAIGQTYDEHSCCSGPELSDWGSYKANPLTMETNISGVFAGGDAVSGAATVVEAFGAGKRAAESIDRFILGNDLSAGREDVPPTASAPSSNGTQKAERQLEPMVGAASRVKSFREIVSSFTEEQVLAEAARCLECGGCSECMQCVTVCERKAIRHDQVDSFLEVDIGAIIVATGFKTFDPSRLPRYGYGVFPNVYSTPEICRMVNATGFTGGHVQLENGKVPKSVGIIHCVGSRDDHTNKYCSATCCMYSLKMAHLIREHSGAEIYNFYIDMRTPGKGYEEFYDRLLSEGTHFIRGRVAEISDWAVTPNEEGKLIIRAEDTLLGVVRRVPVDMVVLAVGMEARTDHDVVRKVFNMSCSKEGWFLERHPKLAPVSTFTAGIFVAGACQGPKDIPASVAQGGAAAAEALALIDCGHVELEPNTAYIDAELCSGCKTCIALCPFTAISYKVLEVSGRGVSEVNEALCKGCGTCVAACPSGTAQQNLFTDDEIFEEISGLVGYV